MFADLRNFETRLFDDFRRLERQMGQLFDTTSRSGGLRTSPRNSYAQINLGVTAEQIDVHLFAPGIDPKRLEITLHQNLLTVKGARDLQRDADTQYYRRERQEGEFYRAVNLPENADPEKVEASYQDGVLHIVIKRREPEKPRQIAVK